MRAYIDAGQLLVVAGNQTYRTLIPRAYARTLADGLKRARRYPGEKRWVLPGGGSFGIWCTKNDPHPMLILHGRIELEPTTDELQHLIETLENYGRTR